MSTIFCSKLSEETHFLKNINVGIQVNGKQYYQKQVHFLWKINETEILLCKYLFRYFIIITNIIITKYIYDNTHIYTYIYIYNSK